MNKLALSAIMIGGLLQTAGCIITSDDGRSGASVEASWQTGACPPGAAAEVFAENVASQERFSDVFDCSAGRGLTVPLPLGDYDVWLEVKSSDKTQLYVQSQSTLVKLFDDGAVANVSIPFFDGFFGFTWNLVNGAGTTLSCEGVKADGVSVLATLADTAVAFDDIFNCADYAAVTDPLLVGTHTISLSLVAGASALGSTTTHEETLTFADAASGEAINIGNFELVY